MMPHIFYIDIYFIFLREWKSAIFRLLINCFYIIQNSRQALPAVVQTSSEYCLLWWTAFIQTDLSEAVIDFVGAIARRLRHLFVFRWLSIFWITNGCASWKWIFKWLRASCPSPLRGQPPAIQNSSRRFCQRWAKSLDQCDRTRLCRLFVVACFLVICVASVR